MSRKRTNRKVYALVDPIVHAAYQASRLTVEEWNTQLLPVQVAVDQLSRGIWNTDTWQPVLECLNRIESLTILNRVKAQDWIESAQDAIRDAVDRMATTGARAFKSQELAMVREIVQVYGDLLKECTHAQFSAACRHTNANITRILSNKSKMHQSGGCVFERAAA